MPAAIDEVLKRTTLFARLAPEDLARVGAVAHVREYERGERIFSEGDASDFFVTIVTGRVKVFRATPAGKEIILEIFQSGDPLGAVAVYEGRMFPASAEAVDPSTCVLIPRQSFLELIGKYPSIARGLLIGLTRRLVELTRRMTELTGGRVESRFARLFLKLDAQMGIDDRGGRFIAMPLSRQELADLTGTTIETCIRIMSRWGKEDVLRTEKDGFVVLDRRTLETIAAA